MTGDRVVAQFGHPGDTFDLGHALRAAESSPDASHDMIVRAVGQAFELMPRLETEPDVLMFVMVQLSRLKALATMAHRTPTRLIDWVLTQAHVSVSGVPGVTSEELDSMIQYVDELERLLGQESMPEFLWTEIFAGALIEFFSPATPPSDFVRRLTAQLHRRTF